MLEAGDPQKIIGKISAIHHIVNWAHLSFLFFSIKSKHPSSQSTPLPQPNYEFIAGQQTLLAVPGGRRTTLHWLGAFLWSGKARRNEEGRRQTSKKKKKSCKSTGSRKTPLDSSWHGTILITDVVNKGRKRPMQLPPLHGSSRMSLLSLLPPTTSREHCLLKL